MLAEIGAELDVLRPLGELTMAQQQIVQIASAVGSGARIIVFDEPTSSLSQVDADRLYELIDRLKQRGVTCIYVSHRMPEVFRLCDTVTRAARRTPRRHAAGRASCRKAELVQLMIGRAVSEYFPRPRSTVQTEELLRVEKTLVAGKIRGRLVFAARGRSRGAGGARRRRTFGRCGRDVRPRAAGEWTAFVFAVATWSSERRARRSSSASASCPRIASGRGSCNRESGLRNTSLPILDRLSRFSWIDRAKEREVAQQYFDRLRVRAPSVDVVVAGLSGGNQQKIVLARWLAAKSKILILDEPTRGVDVGAKAEIHALIGELAEQGAAILLISSELPELLSLSDRILVLRAGRMVGEVARADANQERLLRLMAGLV